MVVFRAAGVRMLDGLVTDLLEAEAINYNNQYIDIYSASWGPTDDGKTLEGPHRYCSRAMEEGVTTVTRLLVCQRKSIYRALFQLSLIHISEPTRPY